MPCVSSQKRNGTSTEAIGLVSNIMHYCLHDGPGIRTTVFFKGCPLSCWWCHNPESRSPVPGLMFDKDRCIHCGTCMLACPHGAIYRIGDAFHTSSACRVCGTCVESCPAEARNLVGQQMTVSAVLHEVEKDVVFWDESGGGVTFSGGEPLAQPAFLDALLDACLRKRIHTAVDTCGWASKDLVLHLSEKVNVFLYDLKLLDSSKHKRYIGVGNDTILENLEVLAQRKKTVVIRFPLIPSINDSDEDVTRMAEFLSPLGLRCIHLLPYHRTGIDKYRRLDLPYPLEGLEPHPVSRVEEIAREFEQKGFSVQIGG